MANGQKLKVGLVFDDSLDRDDGVAQYVKRLGGWLSAQGHEVIYLVGETKLKSWQGGQVYSLSRNQPVKFNGNSLSVPRPANRRKIRHVLDKNKLDVLHVMVPYSPFMGQKIISNVPSETATVGTFHIFPVGTLAKTGGKLLRLIYGRSLSKFIAMTAVSAPAADYARHSFNITADTIIPNPVNIGQFSKSKAKNQEKRIVFLGRLVSRKGCAELIAAFNQLIKKEPGARLIIAGDGPERQKLEKLVKTKGLGQSVEFLGYIQEDQKADLLASATIACFPALYGESFGIVLIEAMAAGSGAVLGGNNPGYASVLAQQPKLLINPKNTDKFADRLYELLTDNVLRLKLHDWQQKSVKQYDVDVVGGQILDIYYQAIARLPKNSHNSDHGIPAHNG